MAELMSYHLVPPEIALLSSFRKERETRVLKDGDALRAFRELVAISGRSSREFALHSLRVGEAYTLAAGGIISEREIQRERLPER